MTSIEAASEMLIDPSALFARLPVPCRSLLALPIGSLLALGRLNRCYREYLLRLDSEHVPSEQAFALALEVMKVSCAPPSNVEKNIPVRGPLVVVSNHPFGGIEGVILAAMLLKVRRDVRVLGNRLLGRLRCIGDYIIPVDPFGVDPAANIGGMKAALRWVKDGGALLTFPSGEVSSFQVRRGRVADKPWSPHIAGIIRRCRATALPVCLPGRNSLPFQLLGMVHPLLRTALLPRELVNKFGRRVDVILGRPVGWPKLSRFSSDRDRIDYLRFTADLLGNRSRSDGRHQSAGASSSLHGRAPKKVAEPVDPRILAEEVSRLPGEALLATHGDLSVHIVRAPQIPTLLREIGRLREITFREVGEGTGATVDLDRFDDTYRHLFLWNRCKRELVGAYRLGLTDRILAEQGPKGLYTSSLFRFKPQFIERLGAAIEFGRSFIRSEYQRQFSSLMLLWKAIGAFVARHPRYHILFGAVSISRDYQAVSRNLMVRFLREKRLDPALSRLVTPRRPYRARRIVGVGRHILDASFQDLDDVSLLVSEVEGDGKGVPVLLRQYLKLDGRLLCFNVDRAFSDVVDGLLLVDLRSTEPRLVRRFMGEAGYRAFSQHHRLAGAQPTPSADRSGWRRTA